MGLSSWKTCGYVFSSTLTPRKISGTCEWIGIDHSIIGRQEEPFWMLSPAFLTIVVQLIRIGIGPVPWTYRWVGPGSSAVLRLAFSTESTFWTIAIGHESITHVNEQLMLPRFRASDWMAKRAFHFSELHSERAGIDRGITGHPWLQNVPLMATCLLAGEGNLAAFGLPSAGSVSKAIIHAC